MTRFSFAFPFICALTAFLSIAPFMTALFSYDAVGYAVYTYRPSLNPFPQASGTHTISSICPRLLASLN